MRITQIRKTETHYCVVDVLDYVTSFSKGQIAWQHLLKFDSIKYGNLTETHKFPGSGQRPTIIVPNQVMYEILIVLPVVMPERIKQKCYDRMVSKLGIHKPKFERVVEEVEIDLDYVIYRQTMEKFNAATEKYPRPDYLQVNTRSTVNKNLGITGSRQEFFKLYPKAMQVCTAIEMLSIIALTDRTRLSQEDVQRRIYKIIENVITAMNREFQGVSYEVSKV